MDKVGSRILFGCIVCTALVVVLFVVALSLTHPSCELTYIDANNLRMDSLAALAKEKPIRAHDKSMLIKISAHLEYSTQDRESSSPMALGELAPTQQPAPPYQQTNSMQSGQPAPLGFNLNPTKHLSPSTPSSVSAQNNSNSSNGTKKESPTNNEKRFLPLKLDKVDSKKIDDNKHKYKLSFNCTVITFIVQRRPERVYVEQISVELKPASRKKSSCEIQLPPQGAFGVDVHDGLAHYFCDKPLKFNCLHHSNKHSAQILAELHIHSIEFETGSSVSNSIHKSREFLSPKSKCV